jgi:Ca-activated chloride channel homolog
MPARWTSSNASTAGERFDAILPASGAYPALALEGKPLAREKLFYSRVALGVKEAKLKALGWDRQVPTWADIARAAGGGQLRYAMTNPASSNSGMSAVFAVASAVAGKTEDLSADEVDGKVLTAFLSGQKLTAGSSGWLADAYRQGPGRAGCHGQLRGRDPAHECQARRRRPTAPGPYPRDGVISADHPLMLLATRAGASRLQQARRRLQEPGLQREATAARPILRPAVPGTAAGARALGDSRRGGAVAFRTGWKSSMPYSAPTRNSGGRPATSIFVLDVSGSMKGDRLDAMRAALKVLAGARGAGDTASASVRMRPSRAASACC